LFRDRDGIIHLDDGWLRRLNRPGFVGGHLV